jgi:AcrR family transcriptional regulator
MPRNKNPEITINKILEVSARLFNEQGFEKTTILDIVDNMDGLTRGAFYHHFKSKEEVLDRLLEKEFYENNPFEKAFKETHLNGLEKIKMAIKEPIEKNLSLSDKTIIELSHSLLENPKLLAEHFKFSANIAELYLEPLVKEGIADGSIKENNPRAIAELIMLLLNVWVSPSIYSPDPQLLKAKALMGKEVLDTLGVPLFDDELMELAFSQLQLYEDFSPSEYEMGNKIYIKKKKKK